MAATVVSSPSPYITVTWRMCFSVTQTWGFCLSLGSASAWRCWYIRAQPLCTGGVHVGEAVLQCMWKFSTLKLQQILEHYRLWPEQCDFPVSESEHITLLCITLSWINIISHMWLHQCVIILRKRPPTGAARSHAYVFHSFLDLRCTRINPFRSVVPNV